LKKNKDLKKIYNEIFLNDETKIFTPLKIEKFHPDIHHAFKSTHWKNKKVLDVGCGTGLFSYMIAKKGAKVLGIDFSEEAIQIAKQKFHHKNLGFIIGDINKIKLEKYDIVVSLGTLEHQDEPLKILQLFKKHLLPKGKIIITSPNWSNPRGYILLTLFFIFNAPITLADLHYFTPIDFSLWANKLKMDFKWYTFEKSWSQGSLLIKDFEKRLPNVLKDFKIRKKEQKISELLNWLEKKALPLDNSLPHSGATALYIFTKK